MDPLGSVSGEAELRSAGIRQCHHHETAGPQNPRHLSNHGPDVVDMLKHPVGESNVVVPIGNPWHPNDAFFPLPADPRVFDPAQIHIDSINAELVAHHFSKLILQDRGRAGTEIDEKGLSPFAIECRHLPGHEADERILCSESITCPHHDGPLTRSMRTSPQSKPPSRASCHSPIGRILAEPHFQLQCVLLTPNYCTDRPSLGIPLTDRPYLRLVPRQHSILSAGRQLTVHGPV